METKRANWRERNVDHYRILDDPWYMLTAISAELPEGETVTTTIIYESPAVRTLSVCSGIDAVGNINCSSGVVEFTDFAPECLQRRNWSDAAPKWRRANPGLCVEGKCVNENCEANGNMVVINMGFCSFELPGDTYMCKCPLCSKHVQPVTCGFNNCRWKWAGKRMQYQSRPSVHEVKTWQIADDAYHLFKPTGGDSGKVQWLNLIIYAEDAKLKPLTCSLCLLTNYVEFIVYECGCKMHKLCVENHPKPAPTKEVCPTCYMKDLKNKKMGFSNFDKP